MDQDTLNLDVVISLEFLKLIFGSVISKNHIYHTKLF